MIIPPPSPADPAAPTARDRLLATADQLFYRDGVRATGIDRIIAESGVAKMSFYRHFPSKSDLVTAFLNDRHRRWMGWFRDALQRHGIDKDWAAIARALAEWFADPDFRGCAFINILAEYADPATREYAEAVRHKTALAEELTARSSELGMKNPKKTAARSMILIEGAIIRAQMGFAAEAVSGLAEMLPLTTRID